MILGVTTCYAQYDPSFSHYFDMEPSFNPGSVGKQAKLNVDVVYALDMAGFEHNPRTMYAAADMPFYAIKNCCTQNLLIEKAPHCVMFRKELSFMP